LGKQERIERLRCRLKRKFVKGITWAEKGQVMGHYERKIYRIVIILLFCMDMKHGLSF